MENYAEEFQKYADRMNQIRMLSTPDLQEIRTAEEYSDCLVHNFSRIGQLAMANRKVIDTYIKPLVHHPEDLLDGQRQQLKLFSELLVEDASFSEVDAHLSKKLNDFLLQEELADKGNADASARVLAMAKKVKRDYYMFSRLTRYPNEDAEEIRQSILENSRALGRYLEKETFLALNEEAKGAALQFTLMSALLYENNLVLMSEEHWQGCLDILLQAEQILEDSFYREQLPEYDWESYEFRIYYYGSFMAYSILPEKVAKIARQYAEKAIAFLEESDRQDILACVDVEQEQDLHYIASLQAHDISAREACDAFYAAYEERDPEDYSIVGMNKNLDSPSSYLIVAKMMKMPLEEKDYLRFREIQKNMLAYIYYLPKSDDKYLKGMTLFNNLPLYFQEVPGGMTMEEFCINAFAAVHPPTYVHVNMVARFAECMARHLLRLHPEEFIGFPGCNTVEDVKCSGLQIMNYTYGAALCHDLGKLFMMDTISTYGRNLLDDEFLIIKTHPTVGALIAMEHESTRPYVDVIKGHHLWFDGRGYPENFDVRKSPYKTVINLVMVADCMDAATDTVGRSYAKGKTYEEFQTEIEEGAGTRYAPFLVDLLQDPKVEKELRYHLKEGREQLYRETFYLLKKQTK